MWAILCTHGLISFPSLLSPPLDVRVFLNAIMCSGMLTRAGKAGIIVPNISCYTESLGGPEKKWKPSSDIIGDESCEDQSR